MTTEVGIMLFFGGVIAGILSVQVVNFVVDRFFGEVKAR